MSSLTKNPPIVRLVACQGSAQLVTALAALRQRQQECFQAPERFRDVLVLFDLCAPDSQIAEFRETLMRMARAHDSWSAIVYLDPAEIERLCGLVRNRGLRFARREMRRRLGVDVAHEVFVARNWQPGNQLVMNCYDEAVQICYGDTIGVYFTEGYLRSAPAASGSNASGSPLRRSLGAACETVRSAVFGSTRLAVRPLDYGYLAAADLFGEVAPFPISIKDRVAMRATLRAIAGTVQPQTPEALRGADGETVIVLTANFSEAQAMSRTDELAAYPDFLRARVPREAKIVLKPHPRDSREKIGALAAELRRHFREVWVLDDERSFCLPFELLLLTALADAEFRIVRSVRLVCFSSSCLGPAFLFALRAEIGFGAELVNRSFAPAVRESRIRHESDLAAAMDRVLNPQAEMESATHL